MLLFLLIYSNSFGTMCDVCIITPLKLVFRQKEESVFFNRYTISHIPTLHSMLCNVGM